MGDECATFLNAVVQQDQSGLQIIVQVDGRSQAFLTGQFRIIEKIADQGAHSFSCIHNGAKEMHRVFIQALAVTTCQELAKAKDRPERLLQIMTCYKSELLKIRIRLRESIVHALACRLSRKIFE
jgi:hypothetical protein